MLLTNIPNNSYATRAGYATASTAGTPLVIYKDASGKYFYKGVAAIPDTPVAKNAKCWTFDDYYLCNEEGSASKTTASFDHLETAAFCVVSSTGDTLVFENMLAVEAYLEEAFAANPKLTFKIFTLVATVKPRPFSLADCIEYVDTSADISQ